MSTPKYSALSIVSAKPVAVIFLYIVLSSFAYAYACGWWGDGEMNRSDNLEVTATYGREVPDELNRETVKLPGTMGYGIALPQPSQAVPYLQATYGRHVDRIEGFKSFGFNTVIDLGTPQKTARHHREETEAAGMRYINIPVDTAIPSQKNIDYFTRMVVRYSIDPILVYSPSAELLGSVWATHRLMWGTPLELAIEEGRSLGMSKIQEAAIRKQSVDQVN